MLTKESLLEILKSAQLDENEIVKRSLIIAEKVHKDQKRDDGAGYLENHIYPLAKTIVERYSSEKNIIVLLCAIILHDVLENSDMTREELQEEVGDDITKIVFALTKSPEENSHELPQSAKLQMNKRYVERIKNCDRWIIILKLEDRLENLISTSKKAVELRPDKYERYILETEEVFLPLTEQVKTVTDYNGLIREQLFRIQSLLNN